MTRRPNVVEDDPARELGRWPLFHWSPASSRGGIRRRGLVPGRRSLDRSWRSPYVAFAEDPLTGWQLSGERFPGVPAWDLWQVESGDLAGGAEALFSRDELGEYVQEWRVYERVPARLLWLAATRFPGEGVHGG